MRTGVRNLSLLLCAAGIVAAAGSVSGRSPYAEIEEKILSKNWEAVEAILNNMPEDTSVQYTRKQAYFDEVKPVLNYMRKYDECDSLDQASSVKPDLTGQTKTLECYHRLRREWRSMPSRLPFSSVLINDLNSKKDLMVKKGHDADLSYNRVFAATTGREIEENIRAKKWDEVHKLTSNITADTSEMKEKITMITDDVSGISLFMQKSDTCDYLTEDIDTQQQALDCYKNLLLSWWPRVPQETLFLPAPFMEEIKAKKEYTDKKIDETKKYMAALEQVENSREYQKVKTACEVCASIDRKARSEKIIASEKRYSAKYGTVNLSLIDEHKQMIKDEDIEIRNGRMQYRKIAGRKFTRAECKKMEKQCEKTVKKVKKDLAQNQLKSEKDAASTREENRPR